MGRKYYSLEINKSNRITRIFQFGFGIICAIVALVWMFIDLDTLEKNGAFWITIVFLLGFAYYQIISGLGRAEKFISFEKSVIIMKTNSVLPSRTIVSTEIAKIEIFPVNIIFVLKTGKTVIFRFGTTFTDIIEPVKQEVENFGKENQIEIEIRKEEF
jgi:hypothetical protein